MSPIAENLAVIRARIAAAAQQAGRSPADVTLVAVSKTHPARLIGQAIAAGATDFGESRLQEAITKIDLLSQERHKVRWHLIGHLQRNKAKLAVQAFDLIHSLDSLRLAETLDRHVDQESLVGQRRLAVLLQLNVSGEASKEGFDLVGGHTNQAAFDALLPQIEAILALPRLEVAGLMTIAPLVAEPEQARPIFARLRETREALAQRYPEANWQHLSMGMTDDFEVAIGEGATLVRVGRAIFGQRPAQ